MKRLLESDINRRNSPTWISCNDDSRSKFWRNMFVTEYGGTFTKSWSGWTWKKEEKDSYIPSKYYVFTDPTGKEVKTFNLSEFCEINSLTRSAMYDTMRGRRRQHKGYFFLREEMNPDYK